MVSFFTAGSFFGCSWNNFLALLISLPERNFKNLNWFNIGYWILIHFTFSIQPKWWNWLSMNKMLSNFCLSKEYVIYLIENNLYLHLKIVYLFKFKLIFENKIKVKNRENNRKKILLLPKPKLFFYGLKCTS